MASKHKKDKKHKKEQEGPATSVADRPKLKNKEYERELYRLQVELCKLQKWVRHKGLRVMIVFEGRDAAGKGGVIKRITERVSPRVFRVVALPAPTEREKTQLYIQRYLPHFPAAGEVVIFDRSWYNRAGVERVMGFCNDEEYERFMNGAPEFEHYLIEDGIILIKYWMNVTNEEQERRFLKRINNPTKHWKLSPMDLESRHRWYDYSLARDALLQRTDSAHAPWNIVDSNDKKRARLNCISHLLSVIPYKKLPYKQPKLPARDEKHAYDDAAVLSTLGRHFVPDNY